MRDGSIDGMQDFDTVIREMIAKEVVTLEDGLSYATNQNNLMLQLKGLASTEDYVNDQENTKMKANPVAAPPAVPNRPPHGSVLEMLE